MFNLLSLPLISFLLVEQVKFLTLTFNGVFFSVTFAKGNFAYLNILHKNLLISTDMSNYFSPLAMDQEPAL